MESSVSNTPKKTEPPLVDIKVTNPLTYLKKWWNKVIGNEGINFSFKIRPLTAIAITTVIASIAFGVGRFVFPFQVPFFRYEEIGNAGPTPSPEIIWKSTAFTGTLQYSSLISRYYLVTTSSEAINLDVPSYIDLQSLIGKRVLAMGDYNKTTRLLKVTDAKDLEVLSKSPVPIPTITPTPTPTLEPTPTLMPSPTP
ncbi:MAG TPA: hypothetical protein VF185_00760 [Patescibacteria group bacterium]